MTPLSVAAIVALFLWFFMTVMVQLPFGWCRNARSRDPLGHLLPAWNFFAPKPVRADFAVWYRSWASCDNDWGEILESDSLPWMELAGIEQRRMSDSVVNPGRYTRKSMFTCCYRIVMMLQHASFRNNDTTGLPSDSMMISLPYLLLITKVSSSCPRAAAVQFRIDVVRHQSGAARASTVFRSAVHRVPSSKPELDIAGHVAAS
jgi:hypothetical protein